MTFPKLCKDCKYCRPDWFLVIISFGFQDKYEYAKCARPDSVDLVSGIKKKNSYCSSERVSYSHYDTCGEEAKYFESQNGN